MIVVDASVAVKWFLNEKYSEAANHVLRVEHKLVGPYLVQYEVAGAFVRAARHNVIDVDDAAHFRDRWLHAISTNVVQLEHAHRDIVRGSELAQQLKHPLADCIYLSMAERRGASLVTADEVFYKRAGSRHKAVVFVAEVHELGA